MSGFVLHPAAYSDLEEIWDYIAIDSPDAADRLIEEILDAIRSLVRFPHQRHERSDLARRPQRFHVVNEYLIAFAPDEQPLLITAIIHGRRNPRVIAATLERRR